MCTAFASLGGGDPEWACSTPLKTFAAVPMTERLRMDTPARCHSAPYPAHTTQNTLIGFDLLVGVGWGINVFRGWGGVRTIYERESFLL